MSNILLADDSPHAQRMGEHILREEGFTVTTVADGVAALVSVAETDPDVIIADAFLPSRNGFELCRRVKHWRPYVRVILTAGLLETFDEAEAKAAGCDAILRKPFEASEAAALIRPLMEAAIAERETLGHEVSSPDLAQPISDALFTAPKRPDPARVEAAVADALSKALPTLVRDITERVLIALGN
jgi:CheY-like chemotaxis protein